MNTLMALFTDYECFSTQGNHSFYPLWFFSPTSPLIFQVFEFSDVMDLDVFIATADFATTFE